MTQFLLSLFGLAFLLGCGLAHQTDRALSHGFAWAAGACALAVFAIAAIQGES